MSGSRIFIVIILIAAIGAGAVALTHKSKPNSTNSAQTTNNSQTSSNSSNPSAGSINIANMMFSPSQITVQKGGSVTWTNNDNLTHTVTVDQGTGPNSGPIEPGKTYSYTFNSTGSFQYHCSIHTSMRGTIVVK